MLYKIIEVSTIKAVGETYVLVHFWMEMRTYVDGKPPYLINDFTMQLRPKGWEKPDEDSPPVETERDVVGELRANIKAYWERGLVAGYRGDHSTSAASTSADFWEGPRLIRPKGKLVKGAVVRDTSDPHKILERGDVKDLPGSTEETLGAGPGD